MSAMLEFVRKWYKDFMTESQQPRAGRLIITKEQEAVVTCTSKPSTAQILYTWLDRVQCGGIANVEFRIIRCHVHIWNNKSQLVKHFKTRSKPLKPKTQSASKYVEGLCDPVQNWQFREPQDNVKIDAHPSLTFQHLHREVSLTVRRPS